MRQFVTISLNGARVRAVQGSNVLDTALTYGICIPHLCHIPNMPGFGACRLCIVEVINNGRAKVTTSCTLDVQEGMVVVTHSEKIQKLRKNVAELLVAEAPNSRAIQDIAVRCGVREVRYPFHNRKCVLCGRCVRLCNDRWRAKAKGFIGRGKERHVDFPFGQRPTSCVMCRDCVDQCPMVRTPCDGPMKEGEEYFCGKCTSQLLVSQRVPEMCVQCGLGEGFGCVRSTI